MASLYDQTYSLERVFPWHKQKRFPILLHTNSRKYLGLDIRFAKQLFGIDILQEPGITIYM